MARFSVIYYITAIMIALLTIQVFFLYFGDKFIAKNPAQSPEKVHLLILSTWRSGSSLVGQFFSQHPDVFYLKEPSWHVWQAMLYNTAYAIQESVRDFIQSIFKCDMFVFDVYIENNSNLSNLFQWASSRALCSPPSCSSFSRTDIITESACRETCGQCPFQKVEDTCNTYNHIVVQEFRIFDLTVLFSLLNNPSINLKILHVVRDPRAIAKSREHIKQALTFDDEIILNAIETTDNDFSVLGEICKSQAEIYMTATSLNLPFLQDRYMFLRYEDLVRKPLKKVREIFSFANLKLPDNLKLWIHEMIRGPRNKKISPFIITPRDALKVSQEWRNVLSLEMITKVQAVCKDAMEIFHYRLVDSAEELTDFTIDTTQPRLKDDFVWLSENKNQ